MANETWTAGPWVVGEDDKLDNCRFIPVETDRRGVCEVQPCYTEKGGALTPQDRANARLIAAAPDLYAALQELLTPLEEAARDAQGEGLVIADAADASLDRARAALTKARGETA